MEEKKFNFKIILVILVPIILLMGVYLLLFKSKDTVGNNQYTSAGMDDAEVKDTSKSYDKANVYSKMAEKDAEANRQKQMSNNDFFDNIEEKKSNYGAIEEKPDPVEEPVKAEPIQRQRSNSSAPRREPLLDMNKQQSAPVEQVEVKRRGFNSANTKSSDSNESYNSSSSNNNSNEEINPGTGKNYINATIQQESVIQSGQQVTIRTTEDCIIKGMAVPKNSYMTGVASISSERVKVTISSINVNGQIIYPKMQVYDLDGNIGIYAPGGVNQDVANGVAQGTAQSGGTKVSGTIPIIGTTISTGGNKKVQVNTARIPVGYKIILKEVKQGN